MIIWGTEKAERVLFKHKNWFCHVWWLHGDGDNKWLSLMKTALWYKKAQVIR